MPERMNFKDMISALDEACGRLIVASYADPAIREAKRLITDVSFSLGEWAIELEEE